MSHRALKPERSKQVKASSVRWWIFAYRKNKDQSLLSVQTSGCLSLSLSDHGLTSVSLYLDLSTWFYTCISQLICVSPCLFPTPPSKPSSLLRPPLSPPCPNPSSRSLFPPLAPHPLHSAPISERFLSANHWELVSYLCPLQNNRHPSQEKYCALKEYFIWNIVTEKLEKTMK